MPVLTSFNNAVSPGKYVQPVSDELLMRGALQDESNITQGKQAIQQNIDSIANIPTVSDADRQVLNQKLESIKGELSKVALQDLRSPAAQSQIQSYVSQFSNDPDVQAIARRGYDYQNQIKKYKELTKDGSYVPEYNMPGLLKAQKYRDMKDKNGKPVYLRDYDISGDIFKSPDTNKAIKDITDQVAESEHVDWNRYGYDTIYQEKVKAKIQDALNTMLPKDVIAEKQREFNYNFQNTDFQGLKTQEYQNDVNNYNSLAQEYLNHGDLTNAQLWQNKAISAKNAGETLTPQEAQQTYFKEHFNDYLSKVADAHAYSKVQSMTQNHAHNSAIDLQNNIRLKQVEAAIPGFGELDPKLQKKVLDGDPEATQQAIQLAEQAKIDIKQAGKTPTEINYGLKDLQDLEQNYEKRSSLKLQNGAYQLNSVPGIFQSDIFEEPIIAKIPKELNADGTISTYEIKTINRTPDAVFYHPGTKEYFLQWKDDSQPNGFRTKVIKGMDGVKEQIAGKSAAYFKMMAGEKAKKEQSTQTTLKVTPENKVLQTNGKTFNNFNEYKKQYQDSILKRLPTPEEEAELIKRWNSH